MTLKELKESILEDGIIDAGEVELLRKELYADGIIDKDEANFLFELNDAVSGKDNSPEWEKLFIQAISDFLLKDEVSPGEIDKDETTWLVEKIGADGKVDGVEKALLANLKVEAKTFPDELNALLG